MQLGMVELDFPADLLLGLGWVGEGHGKCL